MGSSGERPMNCNVCLTFCSGTTFRYVLASDAKKARTAYQDFFALWKDADPDIPILKEAKGEYDKLK